MTQPRDPRSQLRAPTLEDLHVVGPLVSPRVGAALQAHAAAHLPQRLVLVLLQPPGQVVAHVPQVGRPCRSSAEVICAACAPAITALTASTAECTPPVAASEARTLPDRAPSQRSRRHS